MIFIAPRVNASSVALLLQAYASPGPRAASLALATLLGGDPDLLFRLAESTDPDLAAYIHDVPRVPEFLRTAKEMNLTSEDFEVLIEEVRRRRPSEVADTAETSARARCDADFGLLSPA